MYLLFIYVLFNMYNVGVLSAKEQKPNGFLADNIQELSDLAAFKCLSSEVQYLLWLGKSSTDQSLFCSLDLLKNNVKLASADKQLIWMLIHDMFKEKKSTRKANYALKQAKNINKKVYFKQNWSFLGPFQIGKPELDGHPIAFFADFISQRWDTKANIYSELLPSGIVQWTQIQSGADNVITVQPKVSWNEIVMSLQSMAATEWQGLLVNDFAVFADATELLVQCLGVNIFYIDSVLFNGDIYHRSDYWYPVMLDAGVHTIKVFVRANGAAASVQCRVKRHKKEESIQIHRVAFVPDLVDGNWFSYYGSIVTSNWSPTEVMEVKHIEVGENDFEFVAQVKIVGTSSFHPGQVGSINFRFIPGNDNLSAKCAKPLYAVSLNIKFSKSKSKRISVYLRCRNVDQSFLFTFLDHDGSVQQAAVVRPLTQCVLSLCPVLLTLHGTGVKAENQADSYKRMVKNRFVFGVEKLWVLAPTRFGAHNWEGPGELTSLSALQALADLTEHTSWLSGKGADRNKVVFAGHSMGGHGAWQLSVHNPDKALAVISAAGWLSKEDYGDSNMFYRHDVSISYTDPITKSIQESCIAENQADKHASNLGGIPVMMRIGAEDKTVHPYFSRRMFRLLKENRVNVTYNEFPGKDHWWWDTKTSNDGGVTNDPLIRNFATYAVERLERLESDNKCADSDEDNCSGVASRYSSHQESRSSGEFTYVVYNPASFNGGRGVQVIQQRVPLRRSKYTVKIDQSNVHITTSNILSFLLYEPPVDPVKWKTKHVTINNIALGQLEGSGPWRVCSTDTNSFQLCNGELTRDKFNYGPARRIAEQPFVIVVCEDETSTKADSALLMRSATFLANLFLLTSDGKTNIYPSSVISKSEMKSYNVILLGTDSCVRHLGVTPLLKFNGKHIKLGQCQFDGQGNSALYIQPQEDSERLLLLLTSHDTPGINEDILALALPTIPPMVRSPFSNLIPDYVIITRDIHMKGPGGYRCAGFWDNQWKYDTASSSCSC